GTVATLASRDLKCKQRNMQLRSSDSPLLSRNDFGEKVHQASALVIRISSFSFSAARPLSILCSAIQSAWRTSSAAAPTKSAAAALIRTNERAASVRSPERTE